MQSETFAEEDDTRDEAGQDDEVLVDQDAIDPDVGDAPSPRREAEG